jgi:pyruvate/2-oxoglutarate dehydrogenase complex dihydrolipoamide acyltransferase (E2) component
VLRKNIELGPPLKLSAWRKIAIGTWRTAGDPSVYGVIEIDAAAAMAHIEKLRAETGHRVTISHITCKALAETFKKHPGLNNVLRFGRLYPRKTIDVFFQVASDEGGRDLSGTTIRRVTEKSVIEICKEMERDVQSIRQGNDATFKKSKGLIDKLPGFMVGFLLNTIGFIMIKLNLWNGLFGSPQDPFGCAMVTNIGSLGLDLAFAPLVPYSGVPVLLAVGAVQQRPVVRHGQIVVAPVLQIGITFDHRFIDGIHGAKMVRTLKSFFAAPETL